MKIPRPRHMARLQFLLEHNPIVGILGPRQVGKTTLAEACMKEFNGPVTRFDLEDPDDLARLREPKLVLQDLRGLVVIDEIQRRPDLFPVLRVLVDREDMSFLILGSASVDLLRQSSETLAGRIAYHHLDGFTTDEIGTDRHRKLWLRGGFPRSFLAPSDRVSARWRREFILTFLERDIPQLGIHIPSVTLHRFWRMLAHYHGQVWNSAELARAFGVAATTVRRYLDILTGALVLRQFQPWQENLKKRQVKSPKIFIRDSGLLHSLFGLESWIDLEAHPKIGASWEGFVIQEIISAVDAQEGECFFWATHAGAELDFLLIRGNSRYGFEIKRSSAPGLTKSMRIAGADLRLDHLAVVHAGEHSFPLADGIEAIAFEKLRSYLEKHGLAETDPNSI